MTWIRAQEDGVTLTLRVVPRASRTEVAGEIDGALRIRVQAPPIEGKANTAVRRFLADKLGVSASRATVVRGRTGRTKLVHVQGVSAKEARDRLIDES